MHWQPGAVPATKQQAWQASLTRADGQPKLGSHLHDVLAVVHAEHEARDQQEGGRGQVCLWEGHIRLAGRLLYVQ